MMMPKRFSSDTIVPISEAASTSISPSHVSMDERRFDELLDQHQAAIRGFIYSLIQSASDTDDVFQEVCAAMWSKRHDFDPNRPFLPWSLGFAKLQSLSFRRKAGREGEKQQAYASEMLEGAFHSSPLSSQLDTRSEKLESCVNKLSEEKRELLRLRYEEGMTVTEIAMLPDQEKSREALFKTFQRLHQSLLTCLSH